MSTESDATESDATDAPPPMPRRSWKDRLDMGWWQGIAAIAGIVGVIVTIIGVVVTVADGGESPGSSTGNQQSASPSPSGAAASPAAATSSVAPTAVTPDKAGDTNVCSINGSEFNNNGDVNLRCAAPLPASLAKVSFSLGSILSALYLRPADQLPKPNTYPGYDDSRFCHGWGEFTTTAPDLYMVNPIVNLAFEAGSKELVVVKEIRFEIFKRTLIGSSHRVGSSATLINCKVGGGSNPGHIITVNTAKASVTVASQPPDGDPGEYGPDRIMPPASLNSKDLEHNNASISVRSIDGYLYEGKLRIVASLNGQAKTLDIGSRARPLRWLSDSGDKYHPNGNPSRSWNPETQAWVDGTNPYD